MLQIMRWFDHVWRYLRNDDESSEEEDDTDNDSYAKEIEGSNNNEFGGVRGKDDNKSSRDEEDDDDEGSEEPEEDNTDGGGDAKGIKGSNASDMDEEDEVGGVEGKDHDDNQNGRDGEMECCGDESDVEMNDLDCQPQNKTWRGNNFEQESDSESEVQAGRKRRGSQPLLRSSKRRKTSGRLGGAIFGTSIFVDSDRESNSEPESDSESEVQTGRKRRGSQPLLRSSKRRKTSGRLRGAVFGTSIFVDSDRESDSDHMLS